MPRPSAYDDDLAYIHDVGFSDFAKGSAPGLLKTLRSAGIRKGFVVDLGCGSGIWAQQLASAGYDVIGVDISASIVEIARQRVPHAEFHAESFLSFKIPACQAVTALGEVLCYRFDRRNGATALQRLFTRVHAALQPGGLFIFDVAELERDRNRERSFWVGDDWATLVEFDNDPIKQQLNKHIVSFRKVGKHYRRREETHNLQLYKGTKVAEMLRDVGFRVRVVRRYGNFRLPKSLVGFIARKA